MAAYVISQTHVVDAEQYARYRELAGAAVAAHGGRYLARSGRTVVLEDDLPRLGIDLGEGWNLVVIEFADVAAAQAWYDSPEYARALDVRRTGAVERRLTIVEGVQP